MNKVPTFITWIKGAYGDSAFDGGGEDFDISSEKQNVTSDQMGGNEIKTSRKWQFQHKSILSNRLEKSISVDHPRRTLILRNVPTILWQSFRGDIRTHIFRDLRKWCHENQCKNKHDLPAQKKAAMHKSISFLCIFYTNAKHWMLHYLWQTSIRSKFFFPYNAERVWKWAQNRIQAVAMFYIPSFLF
jgi:hypothetical protein